jgi:hypothetical protein
LLSAAGRDHRGQVWAPDIAPSMRPPSGQSTLGVLS